MGHYSYNPITDDLPILQVRREMTQDGNVWEVIDADGDLLFTSIVQINNAQAYQMLECYAQGFRAGLTKFLEQ